MIGPLGRGKSGIHCYTPPISTNQNRFSSSHFAPQQMYRRVVFGLLSHVPCLYISKVTRFYQERALTEIPRNYGPLHTCFRGDPNVKSKSTDVRVLMVEHSYAVHRYPYFAHCYLHQYQRSPGLSSACCICIRSTLYYRYLSFFSSFSSPFFSPPSCLYPRDLASY